MIRYELFYKKFITRRMGDFGNVVQKNDTFELPLGSVLHTTSGLITGFGKAASVTPDESIYGDYFSTKKRFCYFIQQPPSEDDPIQANVSIHPYIAGVFTDIKEYIAQDHSKMFLVKDTSIFSFNAKHQNTICHEPLCRANVTGMMREWRVFQLIMASVLNQCIKLPDRDHFVVFKTENIDLTKTDFTRSLIKYDKTTIRYPDSPYYMVVMNLIGFLHSKKTESVFEKIPEELLSKINIVFQNNNKIVVYQLDVLKKMVMESSGILLRVLNQLNGLKTITEFSETTDNTPEVSLDIKPVDDTINASRFQKTFTPEESKKQSEKSIKEHDKAVDKEILSDSTLTPEKKKFIQSVSKQYKTIKVDDKPLEQIMVEPVVGAVQHDEVPVEDLPIPDKSMLKSSSGVLTKQYLKESFKKDAVSQLVSFGKQGMFLVDYEETDKSDTLSNLTQVKATFKDTNGQQHTIKYTVPKVDEDGLCLINGNLKRMSIQRINTPICKVSPSRVSLSSNFNKTIVERNSSFSNSFIKYLKRIIIKAGDQLKTNAGNNDYPDKFLPYEYTSISSNYNEIVGSGLQWRFQWDNRFKYKMDDGWEDRVKQLEEPYGVFIGFTDKAETFLSVEGILTIFKGENDITKTTILNLLKDKLQGVVFPPFNEWVNFNVLNKKIPVIFVLAYRFGLNHILKYLGITYSTHALDERISVNPSDLLIKFADYKLVIQNPRIPCRLILSGLSNFDLSEINLSDMNDKDVYYDIIQSKQMSINYLRGIDDIFDFFVDPITEDVLRQMNEPTTVKDLLIRATVMLSTEDHRESASVTNFRFRTYERFNAIAYKHMARALAQHRNKPPGSKNKFSISEYDIVSAIVTDPLFENVDTLNPIGDLKSTLRYSHSGDGGRTQESMMVQDRRFPDDGVGVVSEATVDSGKVGIDGILPPNANLLNTRGMAATISPKDIEPSSMVSPTTLLFPGANYDDVKRSNFISIQTPHAMPIKEKSMARVRTGYERVIAQKSRLPFAYAAKENGIVTDINEKLKTVTIEYKSGDVVVISYGDEISKNGGGGFHVAQSIVLNNLSVNKRFNKNDILVYNDNFFTNDPYSSQVDLSLGILCNVAFTEEAGTLDDGSIITNSLSKRMSCEPVRERSISITKDTLIHKIASIGSLIKSIEPLIVFDETKLHNADRLDEKALDAISELNKATPKAKYTGTVVDIKVYHRCSVDEMSPSVKTLVQSVTRLDRAKAKLSKNTSSESTFKNPEPLKNDKLDGVMLDQDAVVIKFYIKQSLDMGNGDKLVYGGALKSVVSKVTEKDIEVEDGSLIVDARMGASSLSNRIVLSVVYQGILERIMEDIETQTVSDFFN